MIAIVIVFGIIAIALYITTYVILGKNMSSSDDWNIVKSNLVKVWIMSVSASIALFLALMMYYKEVQGRDMYMYFILGIACLSLGLSYAAFAITAISR